MYKKQCKTEYEQKLKAICVYIYILSFGNKNTVANYIYITESRDTTCVF